MRRDVRVGTGGKRRSSNCTDGGCLQNVFGNRGLRDSPIADLGNEEGDRVAAMVARKQEEMDRPPLQPLLIYCVLGESAAILDR